MTACPALLKGDEFPDDTPLKVQNSNVPKQPAVNKKVSQ